MTRVQRYVRRAPSKSPDAVLRRADKHLRKLKANKNDKYVCRVQVTEEDSQVLPAKGLGFRRNACSITNIEKGDVANEVRAATTKFHESLHAKDIAKGGSKAITKENEIKAHQETIKFLDDWENREKRKDILGWVAQERKDEQHSIAVLRAEL